MIVVLLMEDVIPFSHDGFSPCRDLCLCPRPFRLCGRPLDSNVVD
jgi:hypothetical protein